MNTSELYTILSSNLQTRGFMHGVLSLDQLPDTITHFPSLYIINTQPSYQRGEHWLAMFFSRDRQGEFFDSFGHPPDYYGEQLLYFISRNSHSWIYNNYILQAPLSYLCGYYCLFYLIHRSCGIPMSTINHMFSLDRYENDFIVREFVKHILE